MTISPLHHRTPVSDDDRELLRLLDLRQSDLVWLFRGPDGALTLAAWNPRGNAFKQLDLTLSGRDIDRLDERGLLTFGHHTTLPVPFDGHSGWPLALTERGRTEARHYTFVRAA